MKKVLWTIATIFAAAGFLTGCPDDDGCTECSCDPSLCDGGGDADADADGDGTAGRGYLTVRSLPSATAGAAVLVDGTEECATDCMDLELNSGSHTVLLSLAGWVDAPALPMGVPRTAEIVNENTTDLTVLLGRDLAGSWRDEATGTVVEVTMAHRNSITIIAPTSACPDTEIFAHGFAPINIFCVEGESLSLCKNHASECGTNFAEGFVSGDGRRVEFTEYGTGIPNSYVYVKVD